MVRELLGLVLEWYRELESMQQLESSASIQLHQLDPLYGQRDARKFNRDVVPSSER